MKTVRQSSLFRIECRHDNSLQRDNFQPMNHFYFIDSKSLTNFGSFITMPFNLISPLSRRRIIYNGFLIKLCSTIDNRQKKKPPPKFIGSKTFARHEAPHLCLIHIFHRQGCVKCCKYGFAGGVRIEN